MEKFLVENLPFRWARARIHYSNWKVTSSERIWPKAAMWVLKIAGGDFGVAPLQKKDRQILEQDPSSE